ncbi:MAG: hypothetical protein GYA36_19285 [Veillonellaceae bacterium]|nr:hypothetical protein [Veillonellaceae bacterium]
MKEIHLYGQSHEHDEAYIVGNREALEELVRRIRQVLDYPPPAESLMAAFTGDGEGFELRVVLTADGDMPNWLLPYYDEMALDPRADAKKPWARRPSADGTLYDKHGGIGMLTPVCGVPAPPEDEPEDE